MIFSAKRNAEYHQKTFRSFNDTPHGILPYELTNELVELVVFWFIGLEEIMLSAHLSNAILEKQIQIMKNLILTGKIL